MTREEIARVRNLCKALETEGPHRTLSHNITAHDLHIVLRAALAQADHAAALLDLAAYTAAQPVPPKPKPKQRAVVRKRA